MSRHANSFTELEVYQQARAVARELFELTMVFPRREGYALTDQLRRASRSIGAQIAEAWAKRRYRRHFISKLTDADAEQLETHHWIELAIDCGYLSREAATPSLEALSRIGRQLNTMIAKADLFCG